MELRKITGKGKAYDHLGNEYNCFADMCRYYGFKPQIVYQRLSYGYSLEKALTTPLRCQVEFKGVIYSSFKELCRKFHINAHSVKTRLNLGWPLEKALTVPIKFYNKQIVYKGFRYRSKKSLCDAFNICRTTLDKYLEKGMTPDEAVDILIKKQNIAVGDMVFKDNHEISKLFSVSVSNVYRILKASDDPEARLLMLQKTSKRRQHNENYWIFNGEKVSTINELTKIMDMSVSWCSERLSKYKDSKTDLSLPNVDHKGNKFKNFKAMCDHYQIKICYAMERYWQTKDIRKTLCPMSYVDKDGVEHVFDSRRKLLLSLGLSLSHKIDNVDIQHLYDVFYNTPVTFAGTTYNNAKELADALNIPYKLLYRRMIYFKGKDNGKLEDSIINLLKA